MVSISDSLNTPFVLPFHCHLLHNHLQLLHIHMLCHFHNVHVHIDFLAKGLHEVEILTSNVLIMYYDLPLNGIYSVFHPF